VEPVRGWPPELTKGSRNDLRKWIKEGDLDPGECELTETYQPPESGILSPRRGLSIITWRKEQTFYHPGIRTVKIEHKTSGSVFTITITGYPVGDQASYLYEFHAAIAGREKSHGYDWEGIARRLREWANEIRREYVDGDLWEAARRQKEFFTGAGKEESVNTPFTPSEQARIAEQLQEIKEYVKNTYVLSIQQAAHVEKMFGEVEDASHRIGRKDWLLLFGGALFSLILSAIVPPEAVQHILTMATHGLGHIFSRQNPPSLPSQL
jgi:hypothetical protein